MKRRFVFVPFLLIFILSSCRAPQAALATDYVAWDEWVGEETEAYDLKYAWYVSMCATGSPDPTGAAPEGFYADPYVVRFESEKKDYSISADSTAKLTMTRLASGNQDADGNLIYVHQEINMERWNGVEWDRMISTQFAAVPNDTAKDQYMALEDTRESYLDLDRIVTVLTPGKYRAVAYINYEPVYAEFELVE